MKPRRPASLVKLATALVVVDQLDLDSQVYFRPTFYHPWPSTAGLFAHDLVSVRDLIYGMLCASGVDAAVSLADVIEIQKQERCVSFMNKKMVELGLSGFCGTPHGNRDDNSWFTEDDVKGLMQACCNNPFLKEVLGTMDHTMTITGVNARKYKIEHTAKQFISLVPGAIAVKTGTTATAGHCLAVYTDKPYVVMACGPDPERYNKMAELVKAL